MPISLLAFQLTSAALTFVIGFVGALLPYYISASGSRTAAQRLSLGQTLSAGVMLGGGLLHLLPDAAETLNEMSEYPYATLCFSLGLLLPLYAEKGLQSFALQQSPYSMLCDSEGVEMHGRSSPVPDGELSRVMRAGGARPELSDAHHLHTMADVERRPDVRPSP